jgi:replicative DNA helicase
MNASMTPVGTPPSHGRWMDHTIDVEYATVGSLLLAPAELEQVKPWLRPKDFYRPICGEVYGLIATMSAAGKPVDPVTVLAELRRGGRLRRDGWPGMELVRMVEAVPTAVAVGYYGRLVLEAALFRQLELVGTRLVQVGRSRRGDVDDAFHLVSEQCADLMSARDRYQLASGDAQTASPEAGGRADQAWVREPASAESAVRTVAR